MEELGSKCLQAKDDKTFIGNLFEKKFNYELDECNKDTFTLEERREQLIRMYDATDGSPQSFRSALLLEILENGLKLEIYDKNYFMLYLANPLKTWHMNKAKVQRD